MIPEILTLVLSDRDKEKLKLARFCREERIRQYRDDYEKEETKRLDELDECDDLAPAQEWF